MSSGDVNDRQGVSAANVEIEIARFNETPQIGKPFRQHLLGLDGLGIRVHRKQGWEFTASVRAENVRNDAHGDR